MASTTITVTETVTRTYIVSDAEIDDLDLPTDVALSDVETDELALALEDSGLEDRYEVNERTIDVSEPEGTPGK